MIGNSFDLEKYLNNLKYSTSMNMEALSQEISIAPLATYTLLFSVKPEYYSIERIANIYSSLPRETAIQYFIDEITYEAILPEFRLIEQKREIPFLSKWLKGTAIKIVLKNLHRYSVANIIIQAFPEYIDRTETEALKQSLEGQYDYDIQLPITCYNVATSNFSPNYQCMTCLSGAKIVFDADNNISQLDFQDGISYPPHNSTYFWGNGGHDCPLVHYTNRQQILLAIAQGLIRAI